MSVEITDECVDLLLNQEEGNSATAYPDTRGFLTIARGVCIDHRVAGAGLPPSALEEANAVKTAEAKKYAQQVPGYELANPVQRSVLISMCFQLGPLTEEKWPNFPAATGTGDWKAAGVAGRDSEWWRTETRGRAEREMRMLETGQWVPFNYPGRPE